MNAINLITNNIPELSALIVAISGSFAAVSALLTYRANVESQKSLRLKNEAEVDIQLIKQFADLVQIANGRTSYQISESAVQSYLSEIPDLNKKSKSEMQLINDSLEELAILTVPVGLAQQNAIGIALTDLAVKYEFLRDTAKYSIPLMPLQEDIKKKCLSKINA